MDIRELKVLIGRNQVRKVLKIVLQIECWKGDEALFDEWVPLSQRRIARVKLLFWEGCEQAGLFRETKNL
jgi:hypothetical protein